MSHILTGVRSVSVSVALCAALAAHAVAGPPDRSQSTTGTTTKGAAAQSPMTNRVASSAPYPVRFKITSFLARQHAREGNRQRALTEYHSMLAVDDPAWPENEAGDAFRIARDMEVARMMAESGFYDHSVRVLETALLLARVNRDPQEMAIERQLQSTVEIAQAKGIAVPLALLNDERLNEAVAQLTHNTNQPTVEGASPEIEPVAGTTMESPTTTATAETTGPLSQPAAVTPTVRADGSTVSPDVSPSYCTACGRHHHHHHTANRSRDDVRVRPVATDKDSGLRSLLSRRKPTSTTTTTNSEPTADAAESQTAPKSQARGTVLSRLLGKRTGTAKALTPKAVASEPSGTHVEADPMPAADEAVATAEAVAAPSVEPANSPAVKKPSVLRRLLGKKKDSGRSVATGSLSDQPAESEVMAASHESATDTDGSGGVVPAIEERPIPESTPAEIEEKTKPSQSPEATVDPAPNTAAPAEASDARLPDTAIRTAEVAARIQVGVAGQVARPGIFTFDGEACTLEAVLMRSGQQSASTDKHVRVVRIASQGPDPAAGNTLVQNREIVLVDGAGARPLYVAVMPYFILQVPVTNGRTTTAAQILEKLAAHWPTIRSQHMGIMRYDNQTSGLAVTALEDLSGHLGEALHNGDVLYIDGTGLDVEQVLPAAKSIANTAGANLQQPK